MSIGNLAIIAGSVSTVIFAASTLPMLLKAGRSKDLASYSRGNIVLANLGNAVHSVYVLHLPIGPIWALHGFYILTSGLMLLWHLRYAGSAHRPDGAPSPLGECDDHRAHRDVDHRRRPGRPGDRVPPAAPWPVMSDRRP